MGLLDIQKSREDKDDKEAKEGIVAVKGRSLLVGNAIYQIPNISTIAVVDLSSDRPIPVILPMVTIGAVVCALASDALRPLSIVVALIFGAIWIYLSANKRTIRYAMSIIMNAGNRLVLMSEDLNFLKRMAITLNRAISEERAANLTFNLDQRQIIDNITNSTVNTGRVNGDIVNNV